MIALQPFTDDKNHASSTYCRIKVDATIAPMDPSSSSNTVQGSVLLPHYRTLEVRPGRIS